MTQLSDKRLQLAVLGSELGGERAGAEREQDVFFEFEVVDEFDVVALADAAGKDGDGFQRSTGGEGTIGEDTEREPVVMLVGKGDEAGMAKHGLLL